MHVYGKYFILIAIGFTLSACSECGSDKLLYGTCEVEKNSSQSLLQLGITKSQRNFVTSIEEWKRRIDFSALANVGAPENGNNNATNTNNQTSYEYYCYFEKEPPAACSNSGAFEHVIDWSDFSSLAQREKRFIVEKRVAGSTESVMKSSLRIADFVGHVDEFVQCTKVIVPSSPLSMPSTNGQSVCLDAGVFEVTSTMAVTRTNTRFYGTENETGDMSRVRNIIAVASSPLFRIDSGSTGFQLHGIIVDRPVAGEGGAVIQSLNEAVTASHIKVRSDQGHFSRFIEFGSGVEGKSFFQKVEIGRQAVKTAFHLKGYGNRHEVEIRESHIFVEAPAAVTSDAYAIHLQDNISLKIISNTIEVIGQGHAIKVDWGTMDLEANKFVLGSGNKSLVYLGSSANLELVLRGNQWIYGRLASIGSRPVIENLGSINLASEYAGTEIPVQREWVCSELGGAGFQNFIGGTGFISPSRTDMTAYASGSLSEPCSQYPEESRVSTLLDSWSPELYGFSIATAVP